MLQPSHPSGARARLIGGAWGLGLLLGGCNTAFGIDQLSYDGDGGAAPLPEHCSNGLRDQDQGEVDVDCGGPCPPCAIGARCSGPQDCASGFCPAQDGVCCDAPCDLTCEACLHSKTGGPDGVCDFVATALDPDPDHECTASAPATCGLSGGGCLPTLTACEMWSTQTLCSPTSCANGVAYGDGFCDGLGHCLAGTATNCFPYLCGAISCLLSCTASTECDPSYYCASPTCTPKLGTGAACTGGEQCLSGSCSAGYCL